MRALDWCFVDDLEPGDHIYAPAADSEDTELEVVACDLVRVPSGPCVWQIHTTGPTMQYEVLERVPRIAA
jgi:hypothetical protein